MTEERKNIPVGIEDFEILKADKESRGLTWGGYLRTLKRDADGARGIHIHPPEDADPDDYLDGLADAIRNHDPDP